MRHIPPFKKRGHGAHTHTPMMHAVAVGRHKSKEI
jgi:hypothetical protein